MYAYARECIFDLIHYLCSMKILLILNTTVEHLKRMSDKQKKAFRDIIDIDAFDEYVCFERMIDAHEPMVYEDQIVFNILEDVSSKGRAAVYFLQYNSMPVVDYRNGVLSTDMDWHRFNEDDEITVVCSHRIDWAIEFANIIPNKVSFYSKCYTGKIPKSTGKLQII